jgi:hypothetical protein
VVVFKNGDGPVWEGPREWWMHNMRLTHTLARTDEHPIHVMSDAFPDVYQVLWFTPKFAVSPPPVPEKAVF